MRRLSSGWSYREKLETHTHPHFGGIQVNQRGGLRSKRMDKRFLLTVAVILVGCGSSPSDPATGSTPNDPPSMGDGGDPEEKDGGVTDAGSPMDATMDFRDSGEPNDAGEPDAFVPECQGSESRCEGSTPQHCVNGSWAAEPNCQVNETCQDGECVPNPECSPGEVVCNGQTTVTCDNEGFWDNGTACPFVCANGACTGVCTPGDKDCQGDTPRTCSNSGQWVEDTACPFQCSAGFCTGGVCTPGDRDCQGDTPRTCVNYQWVAQAACQYQCSAGSCTGECNPGDKDCQGDTPRTCNNNYQWEAQAACQYQCSAGSCTGECSPGDVQCDGLSAQTCNDNFQWVTDELCPFQCSAGSCTGECNLGDKDCQGDTPSTCVNYQWVAGSACQYQCSAGVCTGECNPGDTRCNGLKVETCGDDFFWSAAANCPGADNATGYCEADACTWDCNLDYDDCDGNPNNGCEASLNDDGMNCGSCGHDCCGGACGGGTCQAYDTEIQAADFSITSDNIIWASGTGLEQTDRYSGVTSTLATSSFIRSVSADEAAGYVYWTTSNGSNGIVVKTPMGGGGATTHVRGGYDQGLGYNTPATYITHNSSTVFWSNGWTSMTWESPDPDTVWGAGSGSFLYYAVSDDYVFTVFTQGEISRRSMRGLGGSDQPFVTKIPGSNTRFSNPTTDDVNLYYQHWQSGAEAKTGIWIVPLVGGNPTQLTFESNVASTQGGMVSDGDYIYHVVQKSSDFTTTIRKTAVDGSGSAEILSGVYVDHGSFGNKHYMQVVDECLYFFGNDGMSPWTVWALATTP